MRCGVWGWNFGGRREGGGGGLRGGRMGEWGTGVFCLVLPCRCRIDNFLSFSSGSFAFARPRATKRADVSLNGQCASVQHTSRGDDTVGQLGSWGVGEDTGCLAAVVPS